MLKNYFKVTLRNIWRSKVNSFINILGLSVGIACAILIVLFVKDEVTFDQFHSKIDRLFAVVALAFLISYGWGCELKARAKSSRAQQKKSIFRRGLEDILRLLSNPDKFHEEFARMISWLGSPKYQTIFIV